MCKACFVRYMGTITGISDLDPVRWPNSHWRSVKVNLAFILARMYSPFSVMLFLYLMQYYAAYLCCVLGEENNA